MKRMLWLIAASVCLRVDAQEPSGGVLTAPPQRLEVDVAEVYRRGDYVERIGQGPRSEEETAYLEAMAPPADDSHKWFITVITQVGCAPCAKLKSDIAKAPELQAFIDVTSPKQSWAHYNTYDEADETQNWRWKNLKITAYPTILIQPPRNGRYGDPATVVLQKTGYDGDARKLAGQFTTGIRAYVHAIKTKPPQPVQPAKEAVVNRGGYREAATQAAPPQRSSSGYPRYSEEPSAGGYRQVPLWRPSPNKIELDPPFRPAPRTPPSVTPAIPGPLDLDIPDPLNPDRPVTPPPSPNVTPDKPSDMTEPNTPKAVLIVDRERAAEAFSRPDVQRVFAQLRERFSDLRIEFRDWRTEEFPMLSRDKLPAILVTEDGVLLEALTNQLIKLLGGEDPSAVSWITLAIRLLGGGMAIPGWGWLVAGAVGVIWFIRRRRKQQGLPPVIPAEVTDAVRDLLNTEQVKEILREILTRRTPSKPTP